MSNLNDRRQFPVAGYLFLGAAVIFFLVGLTGSPINTAFVGLGSALFVIGIVFITMASSGEGEAGSSIDPPPEEPKQ